MRITRTRGDTTPDTFTVTNTKTLARANLTGSAFKLTVSAEADPVDSTKQLFQLDGVLSTTELGVVEFYPTAAQADHVGFYYYDVQMTDTYGRVLTLDKDTYVFTQDITK